MEGMAEAEPIAGLAMGRKPGSQRAAWAGCLHGAGRRSAPATLQLAPRGTPSGTRVGITSHPVLEQPGSPGNEPGRELLVRAGGGVFFDTGTQPALQAFDGIGFATSAHFLGAPVPATSSQIGFPTAVGLRTAT